DESSSNLCAVIIPGNPGLIEYYDDFIISLFQWSGKTLPIYGVSHAGKLKNKQDEEASPECTICTGTYSLQEQIKHKQDYIENHIPPSMKIVLIGHSIGAYIALKLLKESSRAADIVKLILLFPTIERMAATPNGRIITPIVNYFKWFAVSTVSVVSYLPTSFTRLLVRWWFSGKNTTNSVVDTTMKLLTSDASNNCLGMAYCEMQEVQDLDTEVIGNNLKKIIFYYGSSDQWAPVSYYEELKSRFPEGEIYLCQRGFEHAFVLSASVEVAEMVWGWIEGMAPYE
ncbi:predicted protein, partial [Nematostella vectensis]